MQQRLDLTHTHQDSTMEYFTPPDITYLTSPEMAGLPFSEAVRVGNLLFLSGQLGRDASGSIVPGGIAAETRQSRTS
jgi:enamine deaminase RidA (YjgF/YER057c/UK114 family)